MTKLLSFLLLLLTPALTAGTAPKKEQIFIIFYDGRTGHRIFSLRGVSVFLGRNAIETITDPFPFNRRTDIFGKATIDVRGVQPRQMRVWVDFIDRDCRYEQSKAPPLSFSYTGSTWSALPVYSIDQIEKTGVVTDNYCGPSKRIPEPGILAIYVVPETLRELWNS